jgi:hypothetical protein
LNKPHNNLGRIFNWLVHQLTSCWINRKLHVRGYTEEGKITPAYPIRVQDKYSININIISSRKE